MLRGTPRSGALGLRSRGTAARPGPLTPERPDAFISYSRRDKDFVESRLAAALKHAGKDVWIDVDDIRGGASDWRATVWRGIEAARVFVFVLSPDSLASRVCGEELAHALSLNKRIIPVLYRSVDGHTAPEALRQPNWISATDDDDFEASISSLVTALETDEQWLDMHARLTQRTREWLRMDRDRSYLLRGRDLRAAEQWLDERGGHGESPTADQVAYINASRRASQRRQAQVLGGVVLALIASIVLGSIAYVQRQTARSQALAARAIDVAERDPEQALRLALKAAGLRHGALVGRALRESIAAARWTRLLRNDGAQRVNDVAFSPDGRLAAIGGEDGTASVWDVRSGRRLASLTDAGGDQSPAVNGVEFSPAGDRIATASSDGTARIWDIAGHKLRTLRVGRAPVWSASFDDRGQRLLTATDTGSAKVWRLAGRTAPIALAGGGADRVLFAHFSNDGRRVLTPARGGGVRVWTLEPRLHARVLVAPANATNVRVATFSPDGRRVLGGYETANGAGSECIWTLARGGGRWCHEEPGVVDDARFSRDGRRLAVATDAGIAVVRATADGRRVAPVLHHGAPINSVAFSRDGRILTAGDDRRAIIWTARGRIAHVLSGHTDAVGVARFSPDGANVLTGSADGTARTWSAAQGTRQLRGPVSAGDVAFSRDGMHVLAVDRRGDAAVWNVRTQQMTRLHGDMPLLSSQFIPPCGRITRCVPWSSDSRYIAGVDADYRPTIWDTQSGAAHRFPGRAIDAALTPDMRRLLVLRADGATLLDRRSEAARSRLRTGSLITSFAFTRDGRSLTVTDGGRVQLWTIRHDHPTARTVVRAGAAAAAITANGRAVAVGFGDGRLVVYDLVRQTHREAPDHPSDVTGIGLDADGKRIWTQSSDRTTRIWDHALRQIAVLREPAGALSAQFSRDGRFVLTADRANAARLWDARLATAELVVEKAPLTGAQLSPDGRFIAVARNEGVELHRCEVCAPLGELIRLARSRLPVD